MGGQLSGNTGPQIINIGFQRAAVFRKKNFLAGVILKKGLSREKEVSEIKDD